MKDVLKNFWQQPAKGYDKDTIGRTEEQILQWEKICGVRFPALYKAQMRLQNGGLPWSQCFVRGDIDEILFINSAEYTAILGDEKPASLTDMYGEDEVAEIFGPDFHPERLYVLSWVYGNGMLCLDYGCRQESPWEDPEVCYFDTNSFAEVFRVESYQTFLEHLVYSVSCYEGRWHLGLKTDLSLEALADHCARTLSASLEKRTDDRYGWFNFDAWYYVSLPNCEGRSPRCILSPNRFNAGTWRFPDSSEFSFILEINLEDEEICLEEDPVETIKRSREIMEGIIKKLDSDSVQATCVMPE